MNPIREVVIGRKRRQGPKVAVIAYLEKDGKRKYIWVTARGSGKWGAIKGNVESYEPPKKTAKVEAKEEAGLKGKVSWAMEMPDLENPTIIFSMKVTKIMDKWKEKKQRKRAILSYKKSLKLLKRNKNRNRWIIEALKEVHSLRP